MTIEIAIITTLGGFILAAAGFFIARTAAAKAEGANFAIMKTDIEYIKREVGEIKDAVKESNKDHDESVRRLHTRIDEHERLYHRKES